MSKAIIYTVNESAQTVAENGNIGLGTIVRRFGCNLNLAGSGIQVMGNGYYKFYSTITLQPTEVGEITVTAYQDNVPIQGAIATETVAAAGDSVNLNLAFVLRQPCTCCESLSNVVFRISQNGATVSNIAVVGEKL